MFYELSSIFFLLTTLALAIFIYKNFGGEKENPELLDNLAKLEECYTYIEQLKNTLSLQNQTLENSNQAVKKADQIIRSLTDKEASLAIQLSLQKEQYQKLLGQKKSSEVRVGQITEQIAPFLEDFPYDPKRARFIGDPIDFIVFGDDKISIVEVKSGHSQLNSTQRKIRDLIKQGKIEFNIYRVKGDEDGTN